MTLLDHVTAIYSKHTAGCCWHVVLDDGNMDDECVSLCEQADLDDCEAPESCKAVGPLLRAMTEGERDAWWESAELRKAKQAGCEIAWNREDSQRKLLLEDLR